MGEPRRITIEGDVVTRPSKPWTGTVHLLLRHLLDRGLPVPEPLDLDGRYERLRLVPGDAGSAAWAHQQEPDGVASAGALLRRLHDASRSWRPPPDATWSVPAEGGTVICHGDPQPANFAWTDGRVTGLFDWDAARPAAPLSDLAYALEWFTPFENDPEELHRRGFAGEPGRRERIAALLDGYGWSGPLDMVALVQARQQRAIDEVVHLARLGHEPHASWAAQGWPSRWQAKLAVTRAVGDAMSPQP